MKIERKLEILGWVSLVFWSSVLIIGIGLTWKLLS